MVTPQWGQFQRPSDFNQLESEEEQEQLKEIPGGVKDEQKPEAEKPQWGNFQTPTTYQGKEDPTEDEGTLQYLSRNIIANASRLGEQIAGRAGNLEQFSKNILTNYPQAGGIVGWALSELMGKEKWDRMINGVPGMQNQMFPTSEQFKEASQLATGGYTKPKTKGEEKFQGFTDDVGAVLQGRTPANLTGQSGARQAYNFVQNKLLIPAAANVTKEVVQGLGFGEDKANLAKMAVWLPLTLAGNVNANNYASHLMNQARTQIPNTVQANVPRFNQRLNDIERTLLTSDPRTQLARQQIVALRNDIATGQTNAQSVLNMYDGTNSLKRSRDLFNLRRNDQNVARHYIDQVRDVVRDEILDFGHQYPQAIQSWQNGVRAWATIHTSNAITNIVDGWARGPYSKLLSGPALGLFGVGTNVITKNPALSIGASATIPQLYKTGQTVYRMWNNPTLANYYWRAVNAAMEENAPVFISNYNKLNDKLKKSESTKPKRKSKE